MSCCCWVVVKIEIYAWQHELTHRQSPCAHMNSPYGHDKSALYNFVFLSEIYSNFIISSVVSFNHRFRSFWVSDCANCQKLKSSNGKNITSLIFKKSCNQLSRLKYIIYLLWNFIPFSHFILFVATLFERELHDPWISSIEWTLAAI